jgi:hypothetical protein
VPAKSFQERLQLCLRDGAMTVSDMVRWFNRPYQTVYKWINEGNIPWGPAGVLAHKKLADLEDAIRSRRRFPIPDDLTPRERVEYMQGVLDEHTRRVSGAGASK